MDDLEFFADLLTTGTVLGLDHTSTPAEVERVFGPAHTYAAPSGRMTDTGLVEFGWWDERVTYFGAQVHRLRSGVEPGGPLVDRYGPFRELLDVDDLLTAVRARGFDPEPVPRWGDGNAGYAEYREPSTGMGVLHLVDPDEAGEPGPAGRVAKMLGSGDDRRSVRWDADEHRSTTARVRHLLKLDDADLEPWLDGHEPAPGPERTDWWRHLRLVASQRHGVAPAEAVRRLRLLTALDRLAVDRGVDGEADAALALAATSAEGHGLGLADVPPVQDAVRRWLDAVDGEYAEARELSGRRPVGADEVRRARALRNRIHDIGAYGPHVTSSAIADRLRAWTDLRPLLLGAA
ncbi:hypothetical protein [Umezawaea tangerina]|uniref:Uncharacterized protein n=1 Tax=Umezawaea tangerina TaxID=84725 RepID=A0A2T0T1S5_9PSEU|nr:hypothetical protein [Umezawaea tangerina]PRY39601.1 hypothetical protein CLV43_107185 [Umezawaea tangerina]